jgi:hypothetical protein
MEAITMTVATEAMPIAVEVFIRQFEPLISEVH